MFSDAPYDRRPMSFKFVHTVILKPKPFVTNNVLFYNKMVRDFGMPSSMLNIGEHWEVIDRKCIFIILNAVVLFEIQPMYFIVMH